MERWRKYFEASRVDLWTICERALTIAFLDDAETFPARRDKLAQKLFAPEKLSLKACEADAPQACAISPPLSDNIQMKKKKIQRNSECGGSDNENLSKSHNPNDEDEEDDDDGDDGGYDDEAEALTEELEHEILMKTDVLSIKETLEAHEMQSEKELFESLERLNLMDLSVETLKATGIGKAVNNLRKSPSNRVRSLSRKLVSEWKALLNDWIQSVAKAALAGTSVSGSPDEGTEEQGLPSPPMDEGALLAATQTPPMGMSQLFDFLEDNPLGGEGNLHSNKDLISDTKSHLKANNTDRKSPWDGTRKEPPKRSKEKGASSSEGAIHRNKSGINADPKRNDSSVGRPLGSERKLKAGDPERRQPDRSSIDGTLNTAKASKVDDYSDRLQASKRRLQQNYRQAENAKKQRTVQVMGLPDLPKRGPNRSKAFL